MARAGFEHRGYVAHSPPLGTALTHCPSLCSMVCLLHVGLPATIPEAEEGTIV
jgi:hypothetical protein